METKEIIQGAALDPVRTRTVAIFSGTASAFTGHLHSESAPPTAISHEAAANLTGAFLTPAAVVALVFGLWRLGVDLDWTENFPVSSGLFSHWLVWIALAVALHMTATALNRWAVAKHREHSGVSDSRTA